MSGVQSAGRRLVHRLLLWRYGIRPGFVLNTGPADEANPPPQTIAADLHRLVKAMEAEAFDSKRGRVDYAALKTGASYAAYRAWARGLQAFDPAALPDREAQLAFWINLYNALIVDAAIRFEIRRSVQETAGFFWRAAYNIGGQRYSTFDIENGILRANRPHPAIPGPHFGRRDPRLPYRLKQLDPRIHFALVCAARSCPPIAVYAAGEIDAQLDAAAEAFINGGGVEIEPGRCRVRLSKIFQWYAPDFGGRPFAAGNPGPILAFIARYVRSPLHREVVLDSRVSVRFRQYEWALNKS